MVQTEEGRLTTKDGTELYTKTWKPDAPPSAILVFVHGFSDHCNAYYDFFPTLASPPYSVQVHSFDQRGWGRSVHTPNDKGLTGPTQTVLGDIHDFVTKLPKSDTPIFLMGHSMGGGEVMHYMLTKDASITKTRPYFTGVLLEAPYIGLDPSSQPHPLAVTIGKLATRIMPNRQILQKLDATYMSRSEKVRNEWVRDPLCHDTGTLGGLTGLLQRAADLVSLSEGHLMPTIANKLPQNTSLWVGHGDGDKVVSLHATQRLYAVLECEGGDKSIKVYPGAYHKLHAEPEGVGEEFVSDVGKWILKKIGGMTTTTTSHGSSKL